MCINPYPANIVCPQNAVCSIIFHMPFRLLLTMEAITMNPDQTALKEAV